MLQTSDSQKNPENGLPTYASSHLGPGKIYAPPAPIHPVKSAGPIPDFSKAPPLLHPMMNYAATTMISPIDKLPLSGPNRTLWVGDLDRAASSINVDENYITQHMFYEFYHCISRVRVCKDRNTGVPTFGFIEFNSPDVANYCLQNLNQRWVPGRLHKYKLNWASFNFSDTTRPAEEGKEKTDTNTNIADSTSNNDSGSACIWVGCLDPATTKDELVELFSRYSSFTFARLITDPESGMCKGFGFAHFSDTQESEDALIQMNGAVCHGRRIRTNRPTYSNNPVAPNPAADSQKNTNPLRAAPADVAGFQCGYVSTKRKRTAPIESIPTRLIVGNLPAGCGDDTVTRHFTTFGSVTSIQSLPEHGTAYVTFSDSEAARNAVHFMNGAFISGSRVTVQLLSEYVEKEQAETNYRMSMPYNMSTFPFSPYGFPLMNPMQMGVPPQMMSGAMMPTISNPSAQALGTAEKKQENTEGATESQLQEVDTKINNTDSPTPSANHSAALTTSPSVSSEIPAAANSDGNEALAEKNGSTSVTVNSQSITDKAVEDAKQLLKRRRLEIITASNKS